MSLVLGVMGIPKVEVELLRIIVRLSSNLRTPWTVGESGACDLLLVDSAGSTDARHAPTAPSVVVPVVQRGEADAAAPAARRTLARPIFAEELVDLLNEMTPRIHGTQAAAAASVRSARNLDRASLVRWPSQATLQKNPVYLRLAAALSRSAQSAESLSALGRIDVDECSTFLGLLQQEGVLAWSAEARDGGNSGNSGDIARARALPDEAARHRTGLLSRIRRRLGLAA
ncbi:MULTISPECIES: hypothetical protein [unclassified Variovorax]|uniref:hypothetical protein n=1 Tax=unclassified Variovorax TaxID=663243 RepID=UPI003F46054E